MTDLHDYITQAKHSGYSDDQIKAALKNEGYKDEQISSALQPSTTEQIIKSKKELNPIVFQVLITGLSFTTSIILSILVPIILFINNPAISTTIILITGLLFGLLSAYVIKHAYGHAVKDVLAGTIIPIIPLMVLMGGVGMSSLIHDIVNQLLQNPTLQEAAPGLTASQIPITNAIPLGIIFYVSFNIFFIYNIIKGENKSALFIYFIAPIIFVLILSLGTFLGPIIKDLTIEIITGLLP